VKRFWAVVDGYWRNLTNRGTLVKRFWAVNGEYWRNLIVWGLLVKLLFAVVIVYLSDLIQIVVKIDVQRCNRHVRGG